MSVRAALIPKPLRSVHLPLYLVALLPVNVLIGIAVVRHGGKFAVLLVALTLLIALSNVIVSRREWLLVAALALPMMDIRQFDQAIPGTGGTSIFVADLLVLLALVGALTAFLAGVSTQSTTQFRTVVLSWPLGLLTAAIIVGTIRGHDRYGTSYLSQPVRLLAYAGIATALVGLSASTAFRILTRIFYAATVYQALLAVYHLATGTSQTASVNLSTGGTRPVALSTAMYMAAALVLALLNLNLLKGRSRRWPHLLIAGLALSLVILAFGRATFLAVAVLLPVMLLCLEKARRTLFAYTPLVVPIAALAITAAAVAIPSLGTTLAQRVSFSQIAGGRDAAVITRQRKYNATLKGLGQTPIFGFGFGRPVQYTNIDGTVATINGDPENSYVYLLAGGGAFALAALLILVVAFLVDALQRLRITDGEAQALVIFAIGLAFVFLVNTAAGPVLTQPDLTLTVWIALLLPALVSSRQLQPVRTVSRAVDAKALTPT